MTALNPVARKLGRALLLLSIGLTTFNPSARADNQIVTEKVSLKVEQVADGLRNPWGMAFLPNGAILVTERSGRLLVVDPRDGSKQSLDGLPEIAQRVQGGLLDVALHPEFESNQWVYLAYAAAGRGGIGTEVARGRLDGTRLRDLEVLFRMQPKSGTGRHFGSRLVFDGKGHLYITLGDRGERPRAQQLDDHAGSVIRLNDDGSVPPDNPYIATDKALPEIFSYGNRNMQGAALHPRTGELWTHEHGPQGGDEINVIRAGVNYGWPVITYGVNYGIGTRIGAGTHQEGMAQPLYYWVPSIAPSGMAFYTGDAIPQWQGNLLVGSLKFSALVRLELDGEKVLHEERLLRGELGRIRDVRQGPDGLVYLLTDASNGGLFRLSPVAEDD